MEISKSNAAQTRIKSILKDIATRVGQDRAIIAVSGGIDSSVCAVLAHRVIADKLFPVYIRTGFNLDKEEKLLLNLFNRFGIDVRILKKEAEFFNKLKDIEDPIHRRYQFGIMSLEFLKNYAKEIGAKSLINGVNKDDKITSNIVNDFDQRADDVRQVLGLKLVEPIARLSKDEVREIAGRIGLRSLTSKQHIPGPGLAIRIAGRITKEKLDLLAALNEYVDQMVNPAEYWQFFPFLLNEKLDGKFIVVLRAVTSINGGLSAEVKYNAATLDNLANKLLGRFQKVGRVFFDISPKPPATIEFM